MKKILLMLCMATSTTLFALDCSHLGITITNNSPHQCVLKHTKLYRGYFLNQAPLIIPSHASTSTFYLSQEGNGIEVELDYRCDDKVLLFASHQEHCGFMAGYVNGYAYNGNDLVSEHQETIGSYWSEIPGQINWIIH